MPRRVYSLKLDAFRAKISVPVTERTLTRLRRFAEGRRQTPTEAARELIERGLPAERAAE